MMNKDILRRNNKGRPKDTWIGQMKKYQRHYGITEEEIQDRQAFRRRLRSQDQSNATTSTASMPTL